MIDYNIKILIKKLLAKDEKDKISWEDLFNQSILNNIEEESTISIENIYINDKVTKTKAY